MSAPRLIPREPEPPSPRPVTRAEDAGWRLSRVTPSLAEVYRSVPITGATWWRKILAFAGPGYLVAVGYMDPGNWATDLAGGSQFGYTLLSVILISNLMRSLSSGRGGAKLAPRHARQQATSRSGMLLAPVGQRRSSRSQRGIRGHSTDYADRS